MRDDLQNFLYSKVALAVRGKGEFRVVEDDGGRPARTLDRRDEVFRYVIQQRGDGRFLENTQIVPRLLRLGFFIAVHRSAFIHLDILLRITSRETKQKKTLEHSSET